MNTDSLFQKKPFIIGMVHFGALGGKDSQEDKERLLGNARYDLDALLKGGVDAVMFENMYDAPHTEGLDKARKILFDDLLTELTKDLLVPFGLSVLWNDYKTGFELAAKTGGSWIRVPVFVDSVETVYGTFHADPRAVLRARDHANARNVKIIADIQVKHARMLEPRPIEASTKAAKQEGADGIIITGTWTGEPATIEDVKEAAAATRLPVFIGSGITPKNIQQYIPYITGVIVGTALKTTPARPIEEERLRTAEDARIDVERVYALVAASRDA